MMDDSATIDPAEFARVFAFEPLLPSVDDLFDDLDGAHRATRSGLFSLHGHVLIAVAQHPDATSAEIAARVGVSERVTRRILADLQQDGVVVQDSARQRWRQADAPAAAEPSRARAIRAISRLYGTRPR